MRAVSAGVFIALIGSAVGVTIISPRMSALIVVGVLGVLLAYRGRIRNGSRDQNYWAGSRIVWPVFFVLFSTSISVFNTKYSLVALAILAIWAVLLPGGHRRHGLSFSLPLILLTSLTVLVWSRGGERIGTIVSYTLITFTVVTTLTKFGRKDVVASAIDGIVFYLGASVFAYFALGMSSPAAGDRIAALDNTTGLFVQRLLFPFESSFVTAPVLAAAFLAALVGLGFPRGRRFLRSSGVALAVFVLLAADYRSPMIYVIVFYLLACLAPRVFNRTIVILAMLAFMAPIWYPVFHSSFKQIESTAQQALPVLQRSSNTSDALSGRLQIWHLAGQNFGRLTLMQQAVGFGINGNIKSGAANSYYSLFLGWQKDVTLANANPHSSLLEETYDGGLVGDALLLGAIALTLARFRKNSVTDRYGMAALGAIAIVVMTGGTETTLLPAEVVQEPYWLFLMLAACSPSSGSQPTEGTLDRPEIAMLPTR